MASVERTDKGKWKARFRKPDGTAGSKTFDRKADAERYAAAVETDKSRGDWVDPQRGRVRFDDWAKEWWATTAGNRASTRARDASYMNTHILPVFGSMQLGAIDHLAVRRWVAELSTRRKPATVQKAAQIMSKVMGAAVDAGILKVSPCANVPLPRIEREEMRFLNPAEVAELAGAIHQRYRALVLVGAYGGLRIGEMAGLRRGRVDLLRGRIDVAEICVEVRGHLTYGPPKTRAGRRSITLPRPVVDELAWHMEKWAGEEFVFAAPEGGPLRTPTWRRRFWAPGIKAAGLEPLRPHDLRHTAVALWISAGANVLEVSRRAGHSSTSFTLDRYGHLFPEADDALSDRLGAVYVGSPTPAADVVAFR